MRERVALRKATPVRPFLKAVPEKQHVLGIVHEPYTVDAQGDWLTPDDLETAAHAFGKALQSGAASLYLDHEQPLTSSDVELLENYVAPADFTVNGQRVRAGTWLQRWHVKHPALWHSVETGELTGFSMGGTGWRTEEPVPAEASG